MKLSFTWENMLCANYKPINEVSINTEKLSPLISGSFEELGGPDLCFPNGFQTLCDALAEGIPQDKILTNHAVKCVYWNRKETTNVS